MIQVHAWSWLSFQVNQDRLEKERKVYFPPEREREREDFRKECKVVSNSEMLKGLLSLSNLGGPSFTILQETDFVEDRVQFSGKQVKAEKGFF